MVAPTHTNGALLLVHRALLRLALGAAVAATGLAVAAAGPASAAVPTSVHNFITGAHENGTQTVVRLPLHFGISHNRPVAYIITDASTRKAAQALGVNYAPKLANLRNTTALQTVTLGSHGVTFPATVSFSPAEALTPGPNGFPPSAAQPGAVGERGYSPFIKLPDGTVLTAPQIANVTGRADKLVAVDPARHWAALRETEGRYDHHVVHYVSFESSDRIAAAIEDVTYVPGLNAAPTLGDESSSSSREGLIAFTNGQTGITNPQRQGLSSAILDHGSPLNILHEIPEQSNLDYSPLWDVRLAQWTNSTVAQHQNVRQDDFDDVLSLVQQGKVTGFGGGHFGPSGFIVTCPIISENI